MENKEVKNETLRDEHLDALIRLAFRREEERTYQQLMEENQQEYTKEEAAQKDAIFARAMEKFAAQEKQRKKKERIQRLKRSAPRIINVAACLALILCISTPIAVARVEFIRVRVMKLLAEIQEDHTRLSLIEDEEAAFNIPVEWKGSHYPSNLLTGFEVSWINPILGEAIWQNTKGDFIHYMEGLESTAIAIDSENAIQSTVMVGNAEALVFECKDKVIVTWTNGTMFFSVSTNLTLDDCLQVALSVRKIEK